MSNEKLAFLMSANVSYDWIKDKHKTVELKCLNMDKECALFSYLKLKNMTKNPSFISLILYDEFSVAHFFGQIYSVKIEKYQVF